VGCSWLSSGLGKVTNPAWTQTGEALQGFWSRAVQIPEAPARPAIAFDWYRAFIQALLEGGHYVWFAKLIVAAELLVGIALILAARYRQHQPGAVHHFHFADPRLEERRLDWA
jgi:thiosulfate dehydrogenase (quinone) large subunit